MMKMDEYEGKTWEKNVRHNPRVDQRVISLVDRRAFLNSLIAD